MTCKVCGEILPQGATSCPNCEAPVAGEVPEEGEQAGVSADSGATKTGYFADYINKFKAFSTTKKMIVAGVALVFLVSLVILLAGGSGRNFSDQQVVDRTVQVLSSKIRSKGVEYSYMLSCDVLSSNVEYSRSSKQYKCNLHVRASSFLRSGTYIVEATFKDKGDKLALVSFRYD